MKWVAATYIVFSASLGAYVMFFSPESETVEIRVELTDEQVVEAIQRYAVTKLGYSRSVVTLHPDGGATVRGRGEKR